VQYCWENEIQPKLDISNLSLSPLRNRIRQKLLPLLKSYNPRVVEALLRITTISRDEVDFLDAEIARLWPLMIIEREGFVILKKDRLNKLSLALKRHLIMAVIENLVGSLKDIEAIHIEAILAAMDKPAGTRIDLPSGLILSIEYDRFVLGIMNVNTCPYPVISGEQHIQVPGKTAVSGWLVNAEIVKPDSKVREENSFVACFDINKTGIALKISHRRPGDRFQPLGMTGMKKLNKFMIDEKVPRHWRRQIPIVFSPKHILWLVGYRIDDRVKVTKETKKVLRLEFKRG
jgi:tRNA(Ile)-lysidine synthase